MSFSSAYQRAPIAFKLQLSRLDDDALDESSRVCRVHALLKILHVEDDADIRGLVELAISFVDDMELIQVADGLAGLSYLRDASPDVILLDDQMPKLSGREVISALKISSRLRRIPVIFMTANSGKEDEAAFMALGACGVIKKPFDPMTLPAFIRDFLKESID